MKILYVEDNHLDADLTVRAMKRTAPDIKVHIVTTQKEAMSILDGPDFSQYDLVLTDMNLPDGDGIFIVSQIRLRSLPLAIVLLTGQGDEETAVSALKSGADDYVVKQPGYLNHLHTCLENALTHYRDQTIKRKKPIRVLYVEHYDIDIDLTCRHFAQHAPHIQLDTANHGDDLLNTLFDTKTPFPYDLLLLDYRLPKANALDILKQIRLHRRTKIPVVLITGKGDEAVAVEALKLGASDYVVKNRGYLFKLPSIIENAFHSSLLARQYKALQESEEKYRVMMESMKDPVYICSADRKLSYMNPAMIKRIGRDATGEDCFRAVHGSMGICPWCAHPAVQQNMSSETEIVSPLDNQPYFVSSSPIVHQNGSISKLTVCRDMSDFKRIEAQLHQAQKLESVGRLAGGVAHDYNNALSVIMGYTELAMTGMDSTDPLYADLNEVIKAARHATSITRQLLAFARKQTIEPVVINLNQTVENMLKMLRRLIGEDIDLAWLPGKGLGTIRMDPSQIDQILANLCVNARDAITGVGRITIETAARVFDESYCSSHPGFVPGDFVSLVVSDNGSGMDKETVKNIFEPFFTTKEVDKGTGLGLATVYGIVKQNNGFINVYSEPLKGTSIKIYLPLHQGRPVEKDGKKEVLIQQGKGETILLVDDDIPMLKIADKILTGLGYTVLPVAQPREAVKVAGQYKGRIHLVVTDMIMPEMNGLELMQHLQVISPELKGLYMSGYTADAIARHGVLDKGVHFIQKPFSKKDLAGKVRAILDNG